MGLISAAQATLLPEAETALLARLRSGAQAVRRGVALLDRVLPNWRKTMRKHADQFDLRDGDHCVLGTLEHHSGLRRLRKLRGDPNHYESAYFRAVARLRIRNGKTLGFDSADLSYKELQELWRAEFSK